MSDLLAKYETLVYASNRHPGYGTPVTVYARNSSEAVERAIEIGWGGYKSQARVKVESVTDLPPSNEVEAE